MIFLNRSGHGEVPTAVMIPAHSGTGLGGSEDRLRVSGPCTLPTAWGAFQLHVFADIATGREHLALTAGDLGPAGGPPLVRIHSECLTGDTLFSSRCDCGMQLRAALRRIAGEGRGVLLYLRQEGRGIGLSNKIRAYGLQDAGLDTVAANEVLGFGADERNYDMCRPMLEYLGVSSLRLLTNNPRKVAALTSCGLTVRRVPLASVRTAHNARYLEVKRSRLGHWPACAQHLTGDDES